MTNLVHPLPKQLIGKQYQLLEPCGEGQFSTVWKALRLEDRAIIALKILKELGNMEILLANEMGPLVGVIHPHIAAVIKAGQADGVYFIEMEYYEGPTLDKMVSSPSLGDSYSLRDALGWMIDVLEAIDFMHSRRVTHGDIKPGNILLDLRTSSVKVIDFGTCHYMEKDVYRKRTGTGTWAYQAPETIQFRERRFASDIYSVGAVLYHLSTGRPPYLSISELIYQPPFPRPRELNPHVPEVLGKAILKALGRLPEDRYHNPVEMIAALQKCMASLGTNSAASIRTKKESKYLRLFVYLGNKLNYRYSDIIAKEERCSGCLAPLEEDKRIISSLSQENSGVNTVVCNEDEENLSLFAYLGYRLGYVSTAITAYEKLLSKIDNGTMPQMELRRILYRLDELYAKQKKLPKCGCS